MHKLNTRVRNLLFVQLISVALIFNLFQVNVHAFEVLDQVKYLVENYYVNEVPEEALNKAAVQELVESLGDPHSQYFTNDEHESFINSINNEFSGIGVYIDTDPEGIKIVSVMEGSPAEEAGIREGDIITMADGHPLAGLSTEEGTMYIKGENGTYANLQVKRNGSLHNYSVVRREIILPTVEGEIIDNHIGYIGLLSFGENTALDFERKLEELNISNPDSYIIDLRSNPGGYLNTAIELAGHFIGGRPVVVTKDRVNDELVYSAPSDKRIIDKPVVFLVNGYSASASEVLSAAVKDYGKAFIIGTNTYGKGTVQNLFELFDGSVLKLTVQRFYSPFGNVIDKLGVAPDLNLGDSDALQAAKLLLGKCSSFDKSGYIKIDKGNYEFEIDLDNAKLPENIGAFMNIIKGLSSKEEVSIGTSSGWVKSDEACFVDSWKYLYPEHTMLNELKSVPVDKKFTVTFTKNIDSETISGESINLISETTGENVEFDTVIEAGNKVIVKPKSNLKAGDTYYLLIHDSIRSLQGDSLDEGTVSKITVSE